MGTRIGAKLAVTFLFAGLAMAACGGGGTTESGPCSPGATRACDCGPGSKGLQTCGASGTSWSDCGQCSAVPPDASQPVDGGPGTDVPAGTDTKPVARDVPPGMDLPEVPRDVPPAAPPRDPCRGTGQGGTAPIGAPCSSHHDCETGYCYDEAWKDEPQLAGHRFCTIGCQGCALSCSDWTKTTVTGNKCIPFRSSGIIEHDLLFRSICIPACAGKEECADAFDGALNTCETPIDFNGDTIGVHKMCLP